MPLCRFAKEGDYPGFVELFRALAPDAPVPDFDRWRREFQPKVIVAEDGGRIVGTTFFDVFRDAAYVYQVIVAADVRGRGIGRDLMRALRAELQARGVAVWSLNVKSDNVAAIALYERLGMKPRGETVSLKFSWPLVDLLPEPEVDIVARDIDPADDTSFERRFDLPSGRLATSRARKGRHVVGLYDATAPAGLAVFFPALPSTYPFHVARPSFAGSLFRELRKRADPGVDFMNVALDDAPDLSSRLVGLGAEVVMKTLRYGGALEPRSSP